MEKEIWKGIDGFEFYEISNHGRVRSKRRNVKRKSKNLKNIKYQIVPVGGRIINGHINKPKKNISYERKKVSLRENGKTHEKMVHTLVLIAFVGPRPIGMECCHKDGNPLNNYYKNLRWGTHKSNTNDSIKHGTKTDPPTFYGEDHHGVTISDEDVERIRGMEYYKGMYTDLSKKYNVAIITISRIYKYQSRANPKNNKRKQIEHK